MNRQEHKIISGQRDIYFLEVMFITLSAGAFFHVGLIGYFFWLGIPEMGFYNIFSVVLFSTGFLVLRSNHKYSNFYFIIGSLEVVLHSFLATYFVGSDAGFPLFLWAIPPVIILHSKIPDWMAIIGCIAISILYVLLSEVLLNPEGVYPMDVNTTKYTFYTCFFSAVSITMAIIFYYRRIVSRKEKIILREIHHRIKNNLQIVSSIASIRNTEFSTKKTSSVMDELRTDVWYLSAIHNQIVVTGNGTLINFSRFMNEVMLNRSPLERTLKSQPHKNELFLNLETGIPLGLISSQVIEFYNNIQSKAKNSLAEFSIVSNTSATGEIALVLKCENDLEINEIRMEESSVEIISLLLEQLDGSHELVREANKITFRIRYNVI